jgi:hypothetical protein
MMQALFDMLLGAYWQLRIRMTIATVTNQADLLWELDHEMDKLLIEIRFWDLVEQTGDPYFQHHLKQH